MINNNTIENNQSDCGANVLLMKKITRDDFTLIYKDKYFKNEVTIIVADKTFTTSAPNTSAIMFAFLFVVFFIATIVLILKK